MTQLRVILDQAAIDELLYDADVKALVEEVGGMVADNAAAAAPKLTGAGAASIHAEVDADDQSVYADVSWTPDRYYLYFAEVGTSRQPATPFLRPALDSTRI